MSKLFTQVSYAYSYKNKEEIVVITTFDWLEVNNLIDILHTQGILYLVGDHTSQAEKHVELDPVQLLQRIAACGYPLVENASISLLILHPEIASSVIPAIESSECDVSENIAVTTLATLYLQQWWLFRLAFALGQLPQVPETLFTSLWANRQLPEPALHYGLAGLLALQKQEQQRSGFPFNVLDDWQNQIRHLLIQEEHHHRQIPETLRRELRYLSLQGEGDDMSMRQHVGRQDIEQFFVQLGRTHLPGRVYLTGGAALVHRGIRPGQTLDIDIQITSDPANLTSQIAQIKQRLNMNIEFASPGDFIPLPAHWESRSEFIGRYGQIDIFYFDWYSIALSKMQRANRQDVVDVQLLVRGGVIEVKELDAFYQDILAKIGVPPYDRLLPNLSQQQFSQHYQAVRSLL